MAWRAVASQGDCRDSDVMQPMETFFHQICEFLSWHAINEEIAKWYFPAVDRYCHQHKMSFAIGVESSAVSLFPMSTNPWYRLFINTTCFRSAISSNIKLHSISFCSALSLPTLCRRALQMVSVWSLDHHQLRCTMIVSAVGVGEPGQRFLWHNHMHWMNKIAKSWQMPSVLQNKI